MAIVLKGYCYPGGPFPLLEFSRGCGGRWKPHAS